MDKPNLFNWGKFKSHSGKELDFKIDCDALSDADLDCLAELIARRFIGFTFKTAIGISTGGLKLANKLKPFETNRSPTLLIIDDVLTTGESMNQMKAKWIHKYNQTDIEGVVIFARGECPDWVTPIFQMW